MRERIYLQDLDATSDDLEREHLARYKFAAAFVTDKIVLDVACGAGYGSYLLASAGAKKCIGIDISEEAVSFAKTNFHADNLEYQVGSATELSALTSPVDRVISFETIEHLDHSSLFLGQIANCLRPEGIAIISTPNRVGGCIDQKPDNPYHIREWSEVEFIHLLAGFFRTIKVYGQRFYFPAGPFPGSRTIRHHLVSMLKPKIAKETGVFEVSERPKLWSAFNLQPQFVVAVCSDPK